MAYFALVNDSNIVTNVVVIDDSDAANESAGATFCSNLIGSGTWKQTYTNGTRKNYAGAGFTYDSSRDAFIPPHPFPSWTVNETTCLWDPPTAKPGNDYDWNETNRQWVAW